jgi:hypothetical protein
MIDAGKRYNLEIDVESGCVHFDVDDPGVKSALQALCGLGYLAVGPECHWSDEPPRGCYQITQVGRARASRQLA